MSESKNKIRLFEQKQVRAIWDEEAEKWWFSIIDIVAVLTEQQDDLTARKYWNKLKQRMKEEGNETVTNCHGFKLTAKDGLPMLAYTGVEWKFGALPHFLFGGKI
jgi:prophage antirepressor-like protein